MASVVFVDSYTLVAMEVSSSSSMKGCFCWGMALLKVEIIASIRIEKVPSLVESACEIDWVGESESCVEGVVGEGALIGD